MRFWSCREVSRMIASGEFDEGPAWRRLLARGHLLGCRYCRRYLREIRLLARAAREWARSLKPAGREAFENRLIERLAGTR